ncbi:alpha/beta hydrolase fold domain-containing protein [Paenibacillus nasutitermitis]|uniref:Esterase n=1 Tax=Paenibacillus nasutitermitis TaxID=1652958 RepID=A0A917DRY6_9BACL|nr:alpha/beta hydrolase [Paenibacillus nasutitermitis]GGD61289.1 esterase [Paenibacillus nasutitermitis]
MKRSIRSKLIESILLMSGLKQRYSDKVKFAKFLEQKRTENAKPYILPGEIQQKLDITMEQSYGKDCYILQGNKQATEKYIIYLIGGGYINQPRGANWKFIRKIADMGNATMIVPVYPKVPHHQYHESYDQVLPIYEKLLLKTSPQNIIFMGDSAGGGFALALAQLLKEKNLPQPSRIILISPWLDISLSNPDIQKFEKNDASLGSYGLAILGKLYAGDTDPNYYLLSPINGHIQGLGEISLFIGTHDLMVADARKFRDRAKKEGVMINYYEYPKMNHVFPAMPIPEAKKAIRQIIDLIS